MAVQSRLTIAGPAWARTDSDSDSARAREPLELGSQCPPARCQITADARSCPQAERRGRPAGPAPPGPRPEDEPRRASPRCGRRCHCGGGWRAAAADAESGQKPNLRAPRGNVIAGTAAAAAADLRRRRRRGWRAWVAVAAAGGPGHGVRVRLAARAARRARTALSLRYNPSQGAGACDRGGCGRPRSRLARARQY